MVSGILLAGGRGERFGGAKALAPFLGRPLVARPFAALSETCEEVLLVRGPAADPALAAACPGARDVADAGEGPLLALMAAAWAAGGDVLVVLPCDAPLATPALARVLVEALEDGDAAVPFLDGRPSPLCAAYRRAALADAAAGALAAGRRAARDALEALDATFLTASAFRDVPFGEAAVADADTPEELAALEALAG